MQRRDFHYLPPLLLLLLLTGGCSSTPVEPEPVRAPAVGSWYASSSYQLNGNRERLTGSEKRDTFAVVSTGNSYRGESDLHLFSSRDSTIYLGYRSSSDVMYRPQRKCGCPENWIPLAVGTKGTKRLQPYDTIIRPAPNLFRWTIDEAIQHHGTESITVPAGTFDTHRMTLIHTEKVIGSKGIVTETTYRTYYFAPSIGYLAKVLTRIERGTDFGPPTIVASGSEQVLTAYEVK